eukprot:1023537-Pyramimonas_sp.AAC.1
MQQADAPDLSETIPVITSPAGPLKPELSAETGSTFKDDSNNANSFADLTQAAGRVQSSECDRWTRLLPPNRFQ